MLDLQWFQAIEVADTEGLSPIIGLLGCNHQWTVPDKLIIALHLKQKRAWLRWIPGNPFIDGTFVSNYIALMPLNAVRVCIPSNHLLQ